MVDEEIRLLQVGLPRGDDKADGRNGRGANGGVRDNVGAAEGKMPRKRSVGKGAQFRPGTRGGVSGCGVRFSFSFSFFFFIFIIFFIFFYLGENESDRPFSGQFFISFFISRFHFGELFKTFHA